MAIGAMITGGKKPSSVHRIMAPDLGGVLMMQLRQPPIVQVSRFGS